MRNIKSHHQTGTVMETNRGLVKTKKICSNTQEQLSMKIMSTLKTFNQELDTPLP